MSNKAIFKYELAPLPKQTISMKMDARILDVQFQRAILCVWAAVRPEYPSVNRTFVVIATGDVIPEGLCYLATVQQNDRLVYHIFEEI